VKRPGSNALGAVDGRSSGAHLSATTLRAAVGALLIILAAILALGGGPIWVLAVIVALPAFVALRARWSGLVAVGTVVVGMAALAFIVLLATAVQRTPLLPTVVVVFAVAGLGASLAIARGRAPELPAARVTPLVLAGVGPITWIAIAGLTAILRPNSGLSWAIHGDSANYVLYARDVTRDGGIVLGGSQNPVPLPAGLLAVMIAPGRGGVSSANLLRHDVLAFESLQVMVIAVTCLLAGGLAGALARTAGSNSAVVAVASGAGSILPLSWTFTTDPLAYGYFDAELALPIVLGCILIALGSPSRPIVAASLLALACTVVLAIWSPLVVIPGGLLLASVIIDRRTLFGSPRVRLVPLALGVGQFVLYAVAVSLPGLLALRGLLGSGGAIYIFTHSLFPSLAVVCVLLTLPLLRGPHRRVATIGLGVPIFLGIGLVALLAESRRADPWTYFPSKFEWLSICVLLVLILGLLPALLTPWSARRFASPVAAVALASMAAIVCFSTPAAVSGDDRSNPLLWIAQGANSEDGGSATAALIIGSADSAHPVVYWRVTNPNERFINYWLLEVAAGSMQNNAVRSFAFGYDEHNEKDLCTILTLLGRQTTVRTQDATLASSLSATCPTARVRVVALSRG
jgi:hypothetical protein